jgi:hypothetical protein
MSETKYRGLMAERLAAREAAAEPDAPTGPRPRRIAGNRDAA